MNKTQKTINKIKTILHYCKDNSVTITEGPLAKYLMNYFSKSTNYLNPSSEKFIIGNYKDNDAVNPTLYIQYDSNNRFSGFSHNVCIVFNDDDAEYKNGNYGDRNAKNLDERGWIEYSEFTSAKWLDILDLAYKKGQQDLASKMRSLNEQYSKCLDDLMLIIDVANKND